MKLLAVAGVRHIFFERDYDSSDKARDAYWNDIRHEYGFEVCERVSLSQGTVEFLLRSLSGVTSERRFMPRSFESYRADA
jgi:hypothetical protein